MKFIILISFVIVSYLGYSQKIEKYEGSFNNGLSMPATVSYSYFKDPKTGNQIKNGSFRYSVKVKDEGMRFSQNFNGSYANGLKNGSWEYTINIKDYKRSSDAFYQTSEIYMKAEYSHGIPTGNWFFKAVISKRNKFKKGTEDKWGDVIPVRNITVNLKFDNGKLIDTLVIKDALGDDFLFLMNSNGLLDGKCEFSKDESEMNWILFENGFEKKSGVGDSVENENPEYQYFIKSKSNKINTIVFDTLSKFDDADSKIASILNSTIFNNEYFLYSVIDGDKMIKMAGNNSNFAVNYTGLEYIKLRNTLLKSEENYVQQINYIKFDISQKLARKEALLRKSKDRTQLEKEVNLLKDQLQKAQLFMCVAAAIKNNLSLENALISSIKSCGNIGIVSKGLSREAYLQKLYTKAKENYIESKKIVF